MMTDAVRAVHMTVAGRVQGVYYRMSAREEALRLGLSGWVRNTPEGNVESHAQGADDAVDQFVSWCRQGPPAARVTHLTLNDAPVDPALKHFSVRT